MSETLKFGNGQFATKKGSTLAYNSENGNFKPLPFTFDRSTSATRVNKQGLIEVVTNNEPRIDFLNDSKGALLLEPSRSNILPYSEDFTNAEWAKSNLTVLGNQVISPDGTLSADKVSSNTSNSTHFLQEFLSTGNTVNVSVFVKNEDADYIQLTNPSSGGIFINFDIKNGLIGSKGSLISNEKIENYGNGWYRISATLDNTGVDNRYIRFYIVSSDNAPFNQSWQPSSNISFYIWGGQAELNSYSTSYIPTQGSIGTRVAESCEQTPVSGIIGQTEGTLFMEVEVLNGVGIQLGNSTSGGDYVNSIQFAISPNSTNAGSHVGGVSQFSNASVGRTGRQKIAVAYGLNNYALYINGTQITVDLSATVPSMSTIIFNHIDLGTVNGEIKQTKLYNTRLSNSELQTLTTI